MLYKNLYIPVFRQKKYVKFLISGFLATLVNVLALYLFHGVFGLPIVVAASMSFVIAYFVSFTLQKFWTFTDDSQDRLITQMFRYLMVGLMGLVINAGGMYLLVEVLKLFYILAQLIMSAGIAIMNYFLYHLIFKNNETRTIEKKHYKKILIATGIYPPDAGGPATYTEILKSELSAKGFEISIVTYGEREDGDFDANISRISRRQNVLSRYVKFFLAVWREAKRADIIFVQGPVSEGLPSYLASRLRRKRYILKVVGDFAWEQGSQRSGVVDSLDDFQNKNYSLRVETWRMIEIFVAHGAERIIVPSEYLKKIVSAWGVDPENIQVIYNSVEQIKVSATKEELRRELGLEGRIILSAGRLVPWKGFRILIEAVNELSPEFGDIRLHIAGDGPEFESLKAEAAKKNPGERIKFLGKLNHEELWKYMRAADLFVLNTGYEGLSHVLIEAMQLGLPIITTRIGGNPELIADGESGLLVPFNDRTEIAQAIEKVFADYDGALTRAEKAKQSTIKFSRERMIDDVVKIFNS